MRKRSSGSRMVYTCILITIIVSTVAFSATSLVIYITSNESRLHQVHVIPHNMITTDSHNRQIHMILFGVGMLITVVLLSCLFLRKFNAPNNKVIIHMPVMENERRGNHHLFKQDLLRKALLGRETIEYRLLQEQMHSFGSKIGTGSAYKLVLLRIDHFSDFYDTYREDIQLMKYAIIHICHETFEPYFYIEGVDMGRELVAVIVSQKEMDHCDSASGMKTDERFQELLYSLQQNIMLNLKCSVSCTIGTQEQSLEACISSFAPAVESSMHHLFYGSGCILLVSEIMAYRFKDYAFPAGKEKYLIDCLMTGKTNEAKQAYTEIVEETAKYPFYVFQHALAHLTTTLNHVCNSLDKNKQLTLNSFYGTLMLSLKDAEYIDEIHEYFHDLFDELGSKFEEKRSFKHDELLHKINSIVERDYADSNLCLTSIADELGMSPIYVSRLYKQFTSKGVTDVINETRITKAQHLLVDTEQSVADIAEQTGFSNSSYFYRIFKKFNGVTPNDYRRRKLSSGS